MTYLKIITILYFITPLLFFISITKEDDFEIINDFLFFYSPFLFSLISLILYKFIKNRIFRIILHSINLIVFNFAFAFTLICLIIGVAKIVLPE